MKLEVETFKTPEVQEAVSTTLEKEIVIGRFMIKRYDEKLYKFEKKYRMKTKEFVKKFEDGKLGDKEEYFEWFALHKAKMHWKKKIKVLNVVAA